MARREGDSEVGAGLLVKPPETFTREQLDAAVAAERLRCAVIVRTQQRGAISGWFSRDDLSEMADAIEDGARGGTKEGTGK